LNKNYLRIPHAKLDLFVIYWYGFAHVRCPDHHQNRDENIKTYPMVVSKYSLKLSFTNRSTVLVFPTPTLPTNTTFISIDFVGCDESVDDAIAKRWRRRATQNGSFIFYDE